MNSLNKLTIKYRRIRSNIDNVKKFSKNKDYIPQKVFFDSDPELIKLLIAPLYGDDPSYGVRELLQNAVDATKELQQYLKDKDKDKDKAKNYKPTVKMEITVEDGDYYFSISDNGIGMQKDTLINYFLKAGSSFRKSDAWAKNFKDEDGHSKVRRSGRFGIGVLASFLLGEEIEVKAKSYQNSEALEFKAKINDEQINLIKSSKSNSGTSVKIKISKDIFEKLEKNINVDPYYKYSNELNWTHWYQLNDIDLYIKVLGDEVNITNDINTNNFNEIIDNDYTKISWKYIRDREVELICNGFLIPKGFDISYSDIPCNECNRPLVSIVDNDGNLPLALNRNSLRNRYLPFEDKLFKEIGKKNLKVIFSQNNFLIKNQNKIEVKNISINYPNFTISSYYNEKERYLQKNNLIFFKNNFNLINYFLIEKLNLNKITVVFINNDEIIIDKFINKGVIFVRNELSTISSFQRVLERDNLNLDMEYNILSQRIFIKKKNYESLFSNKVKRLKTTFKRDCNLINQNDFWVEVEHKKPSSSEI